MSMKFRKVNQYICEAILDDGSRVRIRRRDAKQTLFEANMLRLVEELMDRPVTEEDVEQVLGCLYGYLDFPSEFGEFGEDSIYENNARVEESQELLDVADSYLKEEIHRIEAESEHSN